MTSKVNYGYFSGVGGIAGNSKTYETLINKIMKTTKKLVDTLEENGIVYAYGVDFEKCKAEIKEAEDAEDFVKKYKELKQKVDLQWEKLNNQ